MSANMARPRTSAERNAELVIRGRRLGICMCVFEFGLGVERRVLRRVLVRIAESMQAVARMSFDDDDDDDVVVVVVVVAVVVDEVDDNVVCEDTFSMRTGCVRSMTVQ